MKQEVNLYQVGVRQNKISTMGIVTILLLLGLAVSLAGVSLYTGAQSEEWNRKLQSAEKQRQKLREQVQKLEQQISSQDNKDLRERIQKLSTKRDSRKKLLQVLSGTGSTQQQGFAPFLEVLARQNVSGLWLTGFQIDLQGEPSLRLGGKTTDAEQIPEYLMQLSREKIFSGYTFETLSAERLDDPPGIISFTLATKEN